MNRGTKIYIGGKINISSIELSLYPWSRHGGIPHSNQNFLFIFQLTVLGHFLMLGIAYCIKDITLKAEKNKTRNYLQKNPAVFVFMYNKKERNWSNI